MVDGIEVEEFRLWRVCGLDSMRGGELYFVGEGVVGRLDGEVDLV